MILKIAFGLIAILAAIAGIVALTGDAAVAAAFAFGASAVAAVGVAYQLGRDGRKDTPSPSSR